ncbi:hypothetical protein E6H24_03860 [Candidatus Bathyarchaeota archaeon]|nr:MAG: hypothetical protein E6H24_03860 [Candidatus Bathyarchaeota archaeon]
MMAVVKTALPEEVFQDFFRSYLSDGMGSKYRKRLAQVSVSNGKSLIIDFDDLISFDPALPVALWRGLTTTLRMRARRPLPRCGLKTRSMPSMLERFSHASDGSPRRPR